MASPPSVLTSLAELLDGTARPVYAIDSQRQIVFSNAALSQWLGLEQDRIVGRFVEYHSETEEAREAARGPLGQLTGLCPPPQAFTSGQCEGTVSCVARDGRLVHRHAFFLPLPLAAGAVRCGALAVLAANDLSPEEVAVELSSEPTADELHRAIRRFRRAQAGQYAVESLVGESSAMRKVRTQVAAAASSGVNVLVGGPRGSGRSHIARAIHYRTSGESGTKLVPVDCEVLTEDLFRRTLDSLRSPDEVKRPATLLLANLDRLPTPLQSQLLQSIREMAPAVRMVATVADTGAAPPTPEGEDDSATGPLDPRLLDAVSTITIHVPPLRDRLEDLPILAQCFLEACNQGNPKQVGGMRPEALDMLALYEWPGELDELREVIAAAHETCTGHEVTPPDLPAVVHHAVRASSLSRRPSERIVLDDFLASIEKELIVRALAQAGGNKSEAAQLLGMTRPRLYRRLVQLGLAGNAPEEEKP
jgi:DNA-binding NtrC family response regulator